MTSRFLTYDFHENGVLVPDVGEQKTQEQVSAISDVENDHPLTHFAQNQPSLYRPSILDLPDYLEPVSQEAVPTPESLFVPKGIIAVNAPVVRLTTLTQENMGFWDAMKKWEQVTNEPTAKERQEARHRAAQERLERQGKSDPYDMPRHTFSKREELEKREELTEELMRIKSVSYDVAYIIAKSAYGKKLSYEDKQTLKEFQNTKTDAWSEVEKKVDKHTKKEEKEQKRMEREWKEQRDSGAGGYKKDSEGDWYSRMHQDD